MRPTAAQTAGAARLPGRPALKPPPSKTTPVKSEFGPCRVAAASLLRLALMTPVALPPGARPSRRKSVG